MPRAKKKPCVLCKRLLRPSESAYAGWPVQFRFCEECFIREIQPILDYDDEEEGDGHAESQEACQSC